MAQSRLEKIGTIFTRVTGLLRSGAMKPEDKPIWYDIYAAYPPKLEPRYDRPAPNMDVRDIFYKEDVVRAKYHQSIKYIDMVNLSDAKRETQCQQFIKIYDDLQAQGPLDAEKVFETAKEILSEQRSQMRQEPILDLEPDTENQQKINLAQNFTEAKKQAIKKSSTEQAEETKGTTKVGLSIENLFKE